MRIISQDGKIDIPYEQVVVQRYQTDIYFLNKNLTGVEPLISDMEIATYSTNEKAEIAMEMLRKCYINDEAGKICNDVSLIRPYFQFPKDEDVEE